MTVNLATAEELGDITKARDRLWHLIFSWGKNEKENSKPEFKVLRIQMT